MYETLKALTVEELRAKCKDLGLRNYSDLNEDDLIKKIMDSGKYDIEDENDIDNIVDDDLDESLNYDDDLDLEDDDSDEDELKKFGTFRTFKRLIPNHLTIGEIVVSKDEETFSINESDFSEMTIQRLNHSVGKIIEEI